MQNLHIVCIRPNYYIYTHIVVGYVSFFMDYELDGIIWITVMHKYSSNVAY